MILELRQTPADDIINAMNLVSVENSSTQHHMIKASALVTASVNT